MTKFSLIISVTLTLATVSERSRAMEPRPSGIGVRMTMSGLVFVDDRGMTLYQRGKAPCSDKPEAVRPFERLIYDSVKEFPMRIPDIDSRKSCIQRFPPLVVPVDAKPVGNWTIHERQNGIRQWAYRGNPLYLSVKDHAPDDVHGANSGMNVAKAPLDAPLGIETRLAAMGQVLTTHTGKTLYQSLSDRETQTQDAEWKPLLAPEMTTTEELPANWALVICEGGVRQWALNKKLLYTHVNDLGDAHPRDRGGLPFVDAFGDIYAEPAPGWRPIVLKAALGPPRGVRIMSVVAEGLHIPGQRIYTDAHGKTLYVVTCMELTPDNLACDEVGDSPTYWRGFCGSDQQCKKDWHPFAAPADAQPMDGVWRVAIINPDHPYKPLGEGQHGLPVWTYKGGLVFTYGADKKPGDMWGYRLPGRNEQMSAKPIVAFAPQFTATAIAAFGN